MSKLKTITLLVSTLILLMVVGFIDYATPDLSPVSYKSSDILAQLQQTVNTSFQPKPEIFHIQTPASLKAIYMTSWVAGSPSIRSKLISIMDTTEINAVVIDIKDYTGKISFKVNDPALKAYGADEKRIIDLDSLIATLHAKGIYVIGRVACFQDPYIAKTQPSLAVARSSDGSLWADRHGINWVDAGAKADWDYLALIAKESYARGFDEINYDYIRFPTDGNMSDIEYPFSAGQPKHQVIRSFFSYLHDTLSAQNIPFSVDLFGLTTSAKGDMGIGQEIEDALEFADFVSPMVYPSHFGAGYEGFKNPADHPYDVIKASMGTAVTRADALSKKLFSVSVSSSATSSLSSSTPRLATKLRPWLQDFSLGAVYTPDMIKAQIQATYDVGLTSWMLWNASNRYNTEALLSKK